MNHPWQADKTGLLIAIRLTPKGGRDRLDGIVFDADDRPLLKVRGAAPPVDGAANKALVKLLAKELGVAKSNVEFVSGETARIKRLKVSGDAAELENRLREILKL